MSEKRPSCIQILIPQTDVTVAALEWKLPKAKSTAMKNSPKKVVSIPLLCRRLSKYIARHSPAQGAWRGGVLRGAEYLLAGLQGRAAAHNHVLAGPGGKPEYLRKRDLGHEKALRKRQGGAAL